MSGVIPVVDWVCSAAVSVGAAMGVEVVVEARRNVYLCRSGERVEEMVVVVIFDVLLVAMRQACRAKVRESMDGMDLLLDEL